MMNENECPIEIIDEPCPVKLEQEYLLRSKEWYEPGVLVVKVGGFSTTMELWLKDGHVTSFEDLKKLLENITESSHLKDYLVFKVCPECGLDVPAIDFRDEHCAFCSVKATQNTSVKRIPEETQ